jgi:tetratricopeptide (TPR) repeat protein
MKSAASKVMRDSRQHAVDAGLRLPDQIAERWAAASKELAAEIAKAPDKRSPQIGALLTKLSNVYPHVAYHVSQAQGFGPEAIKLAIEIAEAAGKLGDHTVAEQYFRTAFVALKTVNNGISDASAMAASMRGLGGALLAIVGPRKASMKKEDYLRFIEMNTEAACLFRRLLSLMEDVHGNGDRLLQGILMSLGAAAENLNDYQLALECYRRNSSIKAAQKLPTLAVDKHCGEIEKKVEALNLTPQGAVLRSKLFSLQYDEYDARMELLTGTLRSTVNAHRLERQTFVSTGWQAGPRRAVKNAATGQHEAPTNPVDAAILFKTLIAGAKAAVQTKAFAEAEENYKRALELARDPANAEEISKADQVVVLGSLGFVYCMKAQNELPKQSPEYKATMAHAVPQYRAAVALMEQLKQAGAKIAPETLESALMQLGIVACNIDKPDAGYHLLKRCRALKQKRSADMAIVDKHIVSVEKTIQKRDIDLLQQAAQRWDVRSHNVKSPAEATIQQAVALATAAKTALAAKNIKEAENAAVAAVCMFDSLVDRSPAVLTMLDFRQALTTAGAVYYTMAQQSKNNPPAFVGFNQIALTMYNRALSLLTDQCKNPDDPAFAPTEFNLACTYVNLERYTAAVNHFTTCRRIKERNAQDVSAVDQNLTALGQKVEQTLDRTADALIKLITAPEGLEYENDDLQRMASMAGLTLENSFVLARAKSRANLSATDHAVSSSDEMEFTVDPGNRGGLDGSFSTNENPTSFRAAMKQRKALLKASTAMEEEWQAHEHSLVTDDVAEFARDALQELEALGRMHLEGVDAAALLDILGRELNLRTKEEIARCALAHEMLRAHLQLIQEVHYLGVIEGPFTRHLWGNLGPIHLVSLERESRAAQHALLSAFVVQQVVPALEANEASIRQYVEQLQNIAALDLLQFDETQHRAFGVQAGEARQWLGDVLDAAARSALVAEWEQTTRQHFIAPINLFNTEVQHSLGINTLSNQFFGVAADVVQGMEAEQRAMLQRSREAFIGSLNQNQQLYAIVLDETTTRDALEQEFAAASLALLSGELEWADRSLVTATENLSRCNLERHSVKHAESFTRWNALTLDEGTTALAEIFEPASRIEIIWTERAFRQTSQLQCERDVAEAGETFTRRTDVHEVELFERLQLALDTAEDAEFVARWEQLKAELREWNSLTMSFELETEQAARARTHIDEATIRHSDLRSAYAQWLLLLRVFGAATAAIEAEQDNTRQHIEWGLLETSFEDLEAAARASLHIRETEAASEFGTRYAQDTLKAMETAERRRSLVEPRCCAEFGLALTAMALHNSVLSNAAAQQVLHAAEELNREALAGFATVFAASHHLRCRQLSLLQQEITSRDQCTRTLYESAFDVMATACGELHRSLLEDAFSDHVVTCREPYEALLCARHDALCHLYSQYCRVESEELVSRCAAEREETDQRAALSHAFGFGTDIHHTVDDECSVRAAIRSRWAVEQSQIALNWTAAVAEAEARRHIHVGEVQERWVLVHASFAEHHDLSRTACERVCFCSHALQGDEAFERCLLLHKSLHATATAVDDERQRDSLSDVEFDLREQLIFRYARSRVNWVSEHIVLASDLHHRVIVAHEVQQRQELQLHEYRTRETSERLQLRRSLLANHEVSLLELRQRTEILVEQANQRGSLMTSAIENDEAACRVTATARCYAHASLLFAEANLRAGILDGLSMLRWHVEADEAIRRIVCVERFWRLEHEELVEQARRGLLGARLGFQDAFPIGRAQQLRASHRHLRALRVMDDERLFGHPLASTAWTQDVGPADADRNGDDNSAPVSATTPRKQLREAKLGGLIPTLRASYSHLPRDVRTAAAVGAGRAPPHTEHSGTLPPLTAITSPQSAKRHASIYASRIEVHEAYQRDCLLSAELETRVHDLGRAFTDDHERYLRVLVATTVRAIETDVHLAFGRVLEGLI